MSLNIQGIVDRVFDRKAIDRFIPVTQYEFKQREGRHMMDTAELKDEVFKLRGALEKEGISVKEKATDEEIISAMLTEEQNFEHQLEVNEFNERVERYQQGSLIERLRIMIGDKPTKPRTNPVVEDDFYEEKTSYTNKEESTDSEEVELDEEELNEIKELLGGLTPGDIQKIDKDGETNELMSIIEEVKNQVSESIQNPKTDLA